MTEHSVPVLPPELERRLQVVELDSHARDFDAASWFWMILLGAVMPAGLLIFGWLHQATR